MKSLVPSARDVGREAVTVIAGAIVAAWIIQQFPSVKAWIKKAWE